MGLGTRSWIDWVGISASILAVTLVVAKNVERKPAQRQLLNVSYDPTRELYRELNTAFSAQMLRTTGQVVEIRQLHGGSSRQAQRVGTGEVKADVVTLGLPSDIQGLHRLGLIGDSWMSRLPNESRPYYSTIVFVVRKGNPYRIHDWPDLVAPGVEIITADPKVSGNGKLVALAAWGSVVTRGGSPDAARQFLRALYTHAPFLADAARTAGNAFALEKQGDVQLAWENEARREVAESGGGLELVYPPVSIRAEPAVAWVDANVAADGNADLARDYLKFLFTEEAQEIIARHGYRPALPLAEERHLRDAPPIQLFAVTEIARDWDDAQNLFFAENGIIAALYQPKPR
jgi:sulfate transport system substrate-binding protein